MDVTTPDFAGLRKVISAIEDVPEEEFEMASNRGWPRCVIGTFCRADPADALKLGRGGLLWLFRVPTLGRLRGDDAVYARFGLPHNDDSLLFVPCDYHRDDRISRDAVIQRIEKFIFKYEAKAPSRKSDSHRVEGLCR